MQLLCVVLSGGVMSLGSLTNTMSWLNPPLEMAGPFCFELTIGFELNDSSISQSFPRLFSYVVDGQLSVARVLSHDVIEGMHAFTLVDPGLSGITLFAANSRRL